MSKNKQQIRVIIFVFMPQDQKEKINDLILFVLCLPLHYLFMVILSHMCVSNNEQN